MFKKYTSLAAAMLLAASATVSLGENSIPTCGTFCGQNSACVTTRQDFCSTCRDALSTSCRNHATCWECSATLGAICSLETACSPTAMPPAALPQKPSATQQPSTGEDYTTQSLSMQEQKMANLLNSDRKSHGLAALTLDPELCRIARIKSADMRDRGYFAHESPTYGRVGEMLKHFGYRYSAAGENIAHHANVDKAQAAFMSSSGHRANILNTGWTKVGIGIVQDAQGYIYATQIFAK